MLARADQSPIATDAPPVPAITVENFPGLCMGASMLTSLALHKVGYAALTEREGEALTSALLKNAMAWQLGDYLGNPKIAAALDLVGCFVAILTPRIIAEASKRPATPLQADIAAREEEREAA